MIPSPNFIKPEPRIFNKYTPPPPPQNNFSHSQNINNISQNDFSQPRMRMKGPLNQNLENLVTVPIFRRFRPEARMIVPIEHLVHTEKQRKEKILLQKDINNFFPFSLYNNDKSKYLDLEDKKCSICLCEFENDEKIRFLPCLHRFHLECIDVWLKKHITCPLCKKDLLKLIKLGEKIGK